ncbi:MAG: neutral/alkaline non-lysosomal ceramidase N-terminal domain-containing protein [Lentisphaeria bacterium]|nr:neutral/alkaline non-lysosomal ceramidase N-terminal domain-containing protein [Lentisphaeria bacterium]
MKAGFAVKNITPRVGVELSGFGPYLNRHSIGVRDLLEARAAAFEVAGKRAVVVACDLIGVTREIADLAKSLITARHPELAPADILIACSHTHSGPSVRTYTGWGASDQVYVSILPYKIAQAGLDALDRLEEVTAKVAAVPCEGIGLNREYDKDSPLLEDVLEESWRPAMPERTDTTCTVLQFAAAGGRLAGFMAYFGCHPVVCCAQTRFIHGDYAGVAMRCLMREMPGSVGLFLQGAQGDVNSCVVHKPEQEALLALDVIAARFARAVRHGLREGRDVPVESLVTVLRDVDFTARKSFTLERLAEIRQEQEAIINRAEADDADREVRMAAVKLGGVERLTEILKAGDAPKVRAPLQGIRLGPVAFLGTPFEVMQAIKNDVVAAARSPIPLVMGLCNDSLGYAPDRHCAHRGGYAADFVPLIVGRLPFEDIHGELCAALLELDRELTKS